MRIAILILAFGWTTIGLAQSADSMKEKAANMKNKAADKAAEMKNSAADKAAEMKNSAAEKAAELKGAAGNKVDEVKAKATDMAGKAQNATGTVAPKTVCTSGGDSRTIEVIYDTPGTAVPCHVEYTKGGQASTLWSAANKEGYCEEKALALAEKLGGAGFTCE